MGQPYCHVQSFEPSPDHNLLAYSVDTTGSRIFDLYIKDLRSGELLAGPIPQVATTIAWASDSRTLFYTVFDAAHRSYKLFSHTLGKDIAADRLIWHETDESFMLRVARSRSGAYLLLTISSQSSSEVRYLPADQPGADLAVIQPRQPWMEYYADHHGDRFLIRTNDQARNFKLVEAPVSTPSREHWREVIPHRPDVLIESVLAFRDHLVVGERSAGAAAAAHLCPRRPHGRALRALPRAGLCAGCRPVCGHHQPRVRHRPAALRIQLAGHARFDRGLQHAHRGLGGEEGAGDPQRVRSIPVPVRAPVCHRPGWRPGADLAGVPRMGRRL